MKIINGLALVGGSVLVMVGAIALAVAIAWWSNEGNLDA